MSRVKGGINAGAVDKALQKEKSIAGTNKRKSSMGAGKSTKSKASASEGKAKPQTIKPNKAVVTWFVIENEPGSGGAVFKGDELACLQYIVEFTKANPESTKELYLAQGFKILGY